MGRKRKVAIVDEEKENAVASRKQRGGGAGAGVAGTASNSMLLHGPMYTIMSNVQLNETNHKKYIKELKQLYSKMDHDAFMFTFIKMIKTAMVADEGNEYAETTLLFCAKFVSSYDGEDTHPLLVDMCKWLMTTISRNPHIRYRICQFVNMILKALGMEAALDDAICDRIMEYMLNRLHDTSPNVRLQAILAMQRLQVPDNPDDPVLRAYQFHLCSDPSSRVRQAVITCMGRNYHTIPYILERLWDIDEKVRRHTYLHMSSYPVRSYKVSQRLTLLQQGLNDRSESVRKVVVTIMLQQWIESYQKDLIALISALKLDSSEADIERFRKVAKQTLKDIFKRQSKEDLLACIPLETEGELHRCVPYEKLTMEIALYWQCLTEYLQTEMAEEFDVIVPELSAFCIYVERFCEAQKSDMDKFEQMEFQHKLLSLVEILYTFDLGDEIGRGNLQKLLLYLLKTFRLDEKVIEVIVRCAENLIADQNTRLQYFVEIIQDICGLNNNQNNLLHDRSLINELLASSSNADLNLKLSSLKVKILDLEEQEMNFVQRKDYMRAQQITEEKHATTEEYTNLLQPLLEQHPNAAELKRPLQLRKTVKQDSILKSLQIAFYMVVSPKVRSLDPSIHKLYNDFICRHLASNQIAIRDWALKCGTACSMLYEALAKDVFDELYAQFFKNHNIRIWETSITCIYELLDRYGLDTFAIQEEQSKTKKSGRQLYNTLEYLDSGDDSNVLNAGQGVGVIYMMSHFLDTCDDVCIISAIIVGFCRLILRGYIKSSDIIEKLLLRYFNPSTDPKINQILGVFLENLIKRKKHGLLQPCLLPMISTVLSAPYENPLHDIRPDNITRFIIDSTRQESSLICGGHIHNKLAVSFLEEMLNNLNNKELCKLLSKELITLELNVMQNFQLRNEMKELADKLIKSDFDPKTIKCIIDFKDLVDGNLNPVPKPTVNESEGEEDSNEETDARDDDDTETVTTARSTATERESSEQLAPSENVVTMATATATAITTTAQARVETPMSTVTAPIQVTVAAPTPDRPETSTVTESSTLIEASTLTGTPTLTGVPQSTVIDASIITKDISPTAGLPTTYGRDNRVGHRYLRKSLNLTRGQSDSEAVEGPPRSPKIRIEARIDSDKKTEQPPAEEQRMKSTRARRNLRYNEISAKRYGAESATAEVEVAQTAKDKNKTTGKGNEATNTNIAGKSNEKQLEDVSKAGVNAKQAENKKTASEKRTSPVKPQKEEPTKTLRLPVRSSARSAKPTVNDELNTSDVIPASPVAPASPRTSLRRLRRAGGGDTTVGAANSQRATRSQSAQPPKKAESKIVTTSTATAVSGAPTPPRRPANKRALQYTPKAAAAAAAAAAASAAAAAAATAAKDSEAESRTTSPQHKRLRSDAPANRTATSDVGRVTRAAASRTPSTETEPDAQGQSARVRERERERRGASTRQRIGEGDGDGDGKLNSSGSNGNDPLTKHIRLELPAASQEKSDNTPHRIVTRSRSSSLVRTQHTKDDEAGGSTRARVTVERRSSSENNLRSGKGGVKKQASAEPNAAKQSADKRKSDEAIAYRIMTRSRSNSLVRTQRSLSVDRDEETDGSRSSLKVAPERRSSSENNLARGHKSPGKTASFAEVATTRRRLSLRSEKNATGSSSQLNKSDVTSRKNIKTNTANKSNNNNDDDTKSSSDSSAKASRDTNVSTAAPNRITTRRRSLRERMQTAAAAAAAVEPKPALAPTAKSKVPATAASLTRLRSSRIPVRSSITKLTTVMKSTRAVRVTSSTSIAPKVVASLTSSSGSGSGSGSGSSSADEIGKALVPFGVRRRALTTKMTRINLTQRSTAPVPMHVARPVRAAPQSQLLAITAPKKR